MSGLEALVALEARGWRWRAGPSGCADHPVSVYVGHLWRHGHPRVLPVTAPTLEELVVQMVARAELWERNQP